MKYEKQFHIYFRGPHQQQRGAATPTSPPCQRLGKGLLGPQVSFEEARCHYIQLKVSFKQNGNGWSEGFERQNEKFSLRADWDLFLPLHKVCFLILSVPVHTHTNTGICIHKNTNKSQGKLNNPLYTSALPSYVLFSLLHAGHYRCTTQNT